MSLETIALNESIIALEAELADAMEALKTAEGWISRWAVHVGACRGGEVCTCGLTRVRYECAALLSKQNKH